MSPVKWTYDRKQDHHKEELYHAYVRAQKAIKTPSADTTIDRYPITHPELGECGYVEVQVCMEKGSEVRVSSATPASLDLEVSPTLEPWRGRELSAPLEAHNVTAVQELLTRYKAPDQVLKVKLSCQDISRLQLIKVVVTQERLMILLDIDAPYHKTDRFNRYELLEKIEHAHLPMLDVGPAVYPTPRLLSYARFFSMSAPEHFKALKSLVWRRKKHLNLAIPLAVLDLQELCDEAPHPLLKLYERCLNWRAKAPNNEAFYELIQEERAFEVTALIGCCGEEWRHQQALTLIAQVLHPHELNMALTHLSSIKRLTLPILTALSRHLSLTFYGYRATSTRSSQVREHLLQELREVRVTLFAQASLYRDALCLGLRSMIAERLYLDGVMMGVSSYFEQEIHDSSERYDKLVHRELRRIDREESREREGSRDQRGRALQRRMRDQGEELELSPLEQFARRSRPQHRLAIKKESMPPPSLREALSAMSSLSALYIAQGLWLLEAEQPLASPPLMVTSEGRTLREALAARSSRHAQARLAQAFSTQPLSASAYGGEGAQPPSGLQAQRALIWLSGLLGYGNDQERLRGLCSLLQVLFYAKLDVVIEEVLTLCVLAHERLSEVTQELLSATELPLSPHGEAQRAHLHRMKARLRAWQSPVSISGALLEPLKVHNAPRDTSAQDLFRLYQLSENVERDLHSSRALLTHQFKAQPSPQNPQNPQNPQKHAVRSSRRTLNNLDVMR